MKNGIKKWTVFILALFFLMTACKNENTGSTDADTIKLGGLAPLTGDVAIYGKMASNGAKLAIDEINEAGGILGKQVEFLLEDEQGDASEAVNAYSKLIDEGVEIILGDITSGPTEAVAELANADGVVLITPTGTQDSITENRDFVFRVCYTDPYQGAVLAQYAKDNLKISKAAIMVNNSSDYSDGVAKAFVKKAEELGIEIVAQEAYGNSDTDFNAQLTKIASTKPDILLIPDYYQTIALIAPQARNAGIDAQFIGSDGWDGVVTQLGDGEIEAVNGAVFSNHYSVEDTDEKVQNFLSAFEKEFGEQPASFSALGYDGVYLIKEAIEKAGTVEAEAVKEALKEVEFTGVTGSLRFDDSNNPIKGVSMNLIEDGKYTLDSVVEAK